MVGFRSRYNAPPQHLRAGGPLMCGPPETGLQEPIDQIDTAKAFSCCLLVRKTKVGQVFIIEDRDAGTQRSFLSWARGSGQVPID